MKISKEKRIIYYVIGVALFTVFVQAISGAFIWTYLKVMPFDHFVDIENVEAHDVAVGEQVQKFTIVRNVMFDVDATSVKEVYRIDDSIPNQLYSIPKSTFIYEKDGNDKELNFEITLPRPIVKQAEFYTIDKVCLQLPYNVQKCRVLRLDWQSIYEKKNTIELNIRSLDDVDELIIKPLE